MDEFQSVVEQVRERVVPDARERERLHTVAEELVERTRAAVRDLPVDAEVLLVGSTARGTWLSGERDIDVFVCFPPDLPRDQLEDYGLRVGRAVLPDGREEYAEHPYVSGQFDGDRPDANHSEADRPDATGGGPDGSFDVDLVPCYAVEEATDTRSAVDRTPFHTEYLSGRIDDVADDVRVTKQFLAAVGVYGSDLRTRGFSGYLVELLVLEYGGFRTLIEAAADWDPPIHLDPEDHGRVEFDHPLVVIDPTDPGRNVAAVLSASNLARFIHYARELLADPRTDLFERRDPDPITPSAVRAAVDRRGTAPVAVRFDAPDVVEDQLYPQLEKSLRGVAGALDRAGFDPLRSARFADETAVLLVECGVVKRPAVERHEGPPIGVRTHAEEFLETYADSPADGPFIEDGRYVVERPREYRTPADLLEGDDLLDVALGPDVRRALEKEYDVLVGTEIASLATEFGVELARYFDPTP